MKFDDSAQEAIHYAIQSNKERQMNETVVSEKFIKGLRNIAESRPEQAEQMFPANGAVLKAYRAGALMGGVTLAQTLCHMLGVVFTDNLDATELANLKEQDNV